MIRSIVVCDQCEKEAHTLGDIPRDWLTVRVERVRSNGMATVDVHQFCDSYCAAMFFHSQTVTAFAKAGT